LSASVNRLIIIILSIAYAVILDIVYVNTIAPMFESVGMGVEQLDITYRIFEFCFIVIASISLPINIKKPSQLQAWILYIIVFVPACTIGHNRVGDALQPNFILFLAMLTVSQIALNTVYKLPYINIKRSGIGVSRSIFWIIMCSYFMVAFIVMVKYFGLPEIFSLNKVYFMRTIFKNKLSDAPSIVGYIYWIQGAVICPLLILVGLLRKNITAFIVGIMGLIVMFFMTSLRVFLVFTPFMIGIWYLMKSERINKGVVLFSAFFGLFIASVLSLLLNVFRIVPLLILERWIITPGDLTGAYFDFFSKNEYTLYGYSFLKRFVDYSYGDLEPGQIIGLNYFHNATDVITNATANIWADGFANIGYVGAFLVTGAAIIIMWITDNLFRDYDSKASLTIYGAVALAFTGQGITTCLLTGGILPLLLLVFIGRKALDIDKLKAIH
jgi:hypothetical protein